MTETQKVKFYNAMDGVTGRDGGPYMDHDDARQAEINRARIEKREPDLDNPPATAGQVLLTEAQLVAQGSVPVSKQNGYQDAEQGILVEPVREVEIPVSTPTPVSAPIHSSDKDLSVELPKEPEVSKSSTIQSATELDSGKKKAK